MTMQWPKWVPDGQPEARRARSVWIRAHADQYHSDRLRKPREDTGCPVGGCAWVKQDERTG